MTQKIPDDSSRKKSRGQIMRYLESLGMSPAEAKTEAEYDSRKDRIYPAYVKPKTKIVEDIHNMGNAIRERQKKKGAK
jgi:hypothetical protein